MDEMKNYVIKYLINNYYYDYDKAKNIVEESSFYELLNENTNYIFHYSVDYWGEEVKKEYDELMLV